MSVVSKIRRGQGPVWGGLKRAAKAVITVHLPVNALTRPVWKGLYFLHLSIRESWIWMRKFFWNEPLFRSQCEAVGRGFWMEELPYLGGIGRIVIGDQVRLSGKPEIGFNNRYDWIPEFVVGEGTFIGHQCSFRIGKSIRIGQHCLISGGTTIADFDGHALDAVSRRAGATSTEEDMLPVSIGNDVWIGQGATILKGVTIGDRSIVGTRSVVTKDVPADCVVAGNPARIIKRLQPENLPVSGELVLPKS